ncbi:MAG: hypothetical protein WC521_02590 [Bdellovibrionales bacterium]|jgi:hypothetical protein
MRGGSRYGAGRPCWHGKAEQYRKIDIRRWAREGKLRTGNYFGWCWTRDEEQVASIGVLVDSEYSLTLKYSRQNDEEERKDISFPIRLLRTPCNFGGSRVWFICPHCGKRTANLYLARNGWFCRKSLRLAYASQSEDPMSRMHRRIAKLESKLEDEWEKPKGMHWNNYNRIVDKLNDAQSRLDFAFIQRAASIFC